MCFTVQATPLTPNAVRDAEIQLDFPDKSFGDLNHMQVGVPQNKNESRSLLWFDVSAIPTGAIVTSAQAGGLAP